MTTRHILKLGLALTVLIGQGACATLAPAGRAPATLEGALDSIFSDTAFAHAHWGVLFRSAETGQTLYERNSERLFVPASNVKLLTGFAALESLGPEYRYETRIAIAGPVRDGVLNGNLVVYGTGDPTLSTRFLEDSRDVFRAWADSLRAHGITRIAGGIVGVDTAFADPPLGAGWAWDDLASYYSTEFGALQFNEGAIDVRAFPARDPGSPAIVVLDPATQYVPVTNRMVTAPPGEPTRMQLERDPAGPGITVSGQIAVDSQMVARPVAVRNPTMFFLSVLRETLREGGVTVEGPALAVMELPEGDPTVYRAAPLFTHASPPLREVLPGMMKPSQNWIAETLLRTVGLEARGEGTARAGAAVVDSLLLLRGIDEEMRLADGSGLSRYNLLSPDLLVQLLAAMEQSPNRDLWVASLPIAGVDGTLRQRMRGTMLEGNVNAKTGTLSGVRALSGYLTTASGERVIFSTLVNNHTRTAAGADRVVDAALERVARER